MPGQQSRRSGRGGLTQDGNEFVQLVVDYAKQETLEPLKGLGRFLAFGVAGSVALASGGVILLLAALRALQTETGTTFAGNLNWLPYVITAALAVLVIGTAAWRITKGPAAKRSRGDRRGGR
ncbi:MAG TPA: phage holin family protein [Acidimicrobiales bacterium]|nr:phage holin family protein [Acidimicrobiales bacterium]